MFFQKNIKTVSKEKIEEIQLVRLKWLVDYCYNNLPFYHDRLEKAGVTADKIKTPDDIQGIPYTAKEDNTKIDYSPCKCGRTFAGMAKIMEELMTCSKSDVLTYSHHRLKVFS